ncbi:MAG: FAD-binding protein, partial [Myxococcota bacterium]|nr:FAD-binding protein [Myxococcota bacterium]
GYRILTDTGQRLLSKNIIVATGGFGRNIALIQEVYPSMAENLWHSEAWPYAYGSGLELLSTLASVNPFVSLHVHGATDPLLGQPEVMIIGALSKALIVNQAGERLYNEEDFEQIHFGASQISQNSFYALFDEPLWSNTAFKALSFNHPDLEDQMFTSSQYEGNEAVSSAETWTQLATKIGIDSDRLDHTVQTYNSHIQENLDPLGKDLNDSPAIGLPPLYALPLQYSTGRSFNGVRTNENMQVCNETKCHQGLYAVGEIQGLMCASEGGYNGSITAAIYSGYTAANHIGSLE